MIPLISLETYISNVFFDIVIQDQDDIAELSFERNFSPHVKEMSVHLTSSLLFSIPLKPTILPLPHSPGITRTFADPPDNSNNSRPLSFKATHDLIFQLRSTITNRQLICHSFVVAPTAGDIEGKTRSVAHIAQFSGV
jgi:hypothetical protein